MIAAEELQKIIETGIRFTLRQRDDGRFDVKVGNYRHFADAQVTVATFEEAVAWLREHVRARYPESGYAKSFVPD